ncbi:TerB family tellurite resistance protein [Helicobacter labetoulli]|uniref:TerB family tellurite resistance protein n=1 Tax=Helicobacter labetoulli TaxID=2315333 RepID=UPI000EF6A363|nr:TerB family tellurite resistance protein [Helicobacter labetoulli]
MEIVLLLIAGVVIYFLYNTLQDYLKNPLHQNPQNMPFGSNNADNTPINFDNPYQMQDPWVGKIKSNEFSILAAIIARVVWSDEQICLLEKQLLDEILSDMAAESKNPRLSKEELEEIVQKEQTPSISLDELCESYVALTKGEYKKRLKVVEFLFALAYADGKLEDSEQESIVDIAAYFEIANDDFNAIYNAFEKEYADELKMDLKQAKAIFELTDTNELDKAKLSEKYHNLIKQTKQNIFDNKNINKSFQDTSLTYLKEIDKAYSILLELLESKGEDTSKQEYSSNDEKQEVEQDKSRKGWDF